jgi:hypothetical protein
MWTLAEEEEAALEMVEVGHSEGMKALAIGKIAPAENWRPPICWTKRSRKLAMNKMRRRRMRQARGLVQKSNKI